MNVLFVIPVLNEETTIGKTIASIEKFTPSSINYTIVVVDNGSTDKTTEIVNKTIAQLLEIPDKSIAGLRNIGVKYSDNEFLVFLDSDILLTEKWMIHIVSVLDELKLKPFTVTGSRVFPENNDSFLNKYWFYRMTMYESPYINSGHLITSRVLFNELGGFTEELRTAEDYDFCMKAKKVGAKIVNNPSLPVIHLGYPKTIAGFIGRERWHGRQDFISISSFKESKIAWLSTFNILSVFFSVVLSMLLDNYLILFLYPFIMGGTSVFLTVYKFGLQPLSLLMGTSLLFYFYLWGRSMALLDRFFK